MSGHLYQQVASLAFKEGNSVKLQEFFKAYEHNHWEKLSEFHEWNGALDNAVAWLFQCLDGRHLLTIMYDPYELYDTASLCGKRKSTPAILPFFKMIGSEFEVRLH